MNNEYVVTISGEGFPTSETVLTDVKSALLMAADARAAGLTASTAPRGHRTPAATAIPIVLSAPITSPTATVPGLRNYPQTPAKAAKPPKAPKPKKPPKEAKSSFRTLRGKIDRLTHAKVILVLVETLVRRGLSGATDDELAQAAGIKEKAVVQHLFTLHKQVGHKVFGGGRAVGYSTLWSDGDLRCLHPAFIRRWREENPEVPAPAAAAPTPAGTPVPAAEAETANLPITASQHRRPKPVELQPISPGNEQRVNYAVMVHKLATRSRNFLLALLRNPHQGMTREVWCHEAGRADASRINSLLNALKSLGERFGFDGTIFNEVSTLTGPDIVTHYYANNAFLDRYLADLTIIKQGHPEWLDEKGNLADHRADQQRLSDDEEKEESESP